MGKVDYLTEVDEKLRYCTREASRTHGIDRYGEDIMHYNSDLCEECDETYWEYQNSRDDIMRAVIDGRRITKNKRLCFMRACDRVCELYGKFKREQEFQKELARALEISRAKETLEQVVNGDQSLDEDPSDSPLPF